LGSVTGVPVASYVIEGRGQPSRLLVLLHGFDADEHGLAALGPLIDPEARFLIAAPRGPVVAPGTTGRSWWRYGARGPDPETFHGSFHALHEEIDRLCATHLMTRDEMVIGGFSQGAAMALAVALGASSRPRPAGIVCLSGFLADVDGLEYDWDADADLPVLVQHGRADEVVPVDLGSDTAHILEQHGLEVTWHEYRMGHQTTLESLSDARDWLAGVG
jgi:phospholipase/carboxylesterase